MTRDVPTHHDARTAWAIWSPWTGLLMPTLAQTRSDAIEKFEDRIFPNWVKWRRKGMRCIRVAVVPAESYP